MSSSKQSVYICFKSTQNRLNFRVKLIFKSYQINRAKINEMII